MKITSDSFSECGQFREENEDYILCDIRINLFIIADGLGGLVGGREASKRAAELFAREFANNDNEIADVQLRLESALLSANRTLFFEALAKNVKSGTTFTAVHIAGRLMNFIHVGDTVLWLLNAKENSFIPLARQDTLEREHIRKGSPPILASQYRNVLTQAVGIGEFISPQLASVELNPQDLIVLCTDGFSGCVAPFEVLDLAKMEEPVSAFTERLKQLAVARNPKDNFSAILLLVV